MGKTQNSIRDDMNRDEYLQRAHEFASRGEKRPNAKLCAKRVKEIRENRHGLSAKALAQLYGCHYQTIEKVRHFETWIHV